MSAGSPDIYERYVTWGGLGNLVGLAKVSDTDRAQMNSAGCRSNTYGKVDIEHPAVVEYLQKRRLISPKLARGQRRKVGPAPTPTEPRVPPSSTPERDIGYDPIAAVAELARKLVPDPVPAAPPTTGSETEAVLGAMIADSAHSLPDNLGELSMRDAIDRYGSIPQMRDVVKALKDHADMRSKEDTTLRRRGTLIDRDRVSLAIFPLVEQMYKRLIEDCPESVVPIVIAKVKRGGDRLETEIAEVIRKEISKIAKDVKGAVSAQLASWKEVDDGED